MSKSNFIGNFVFIYLGLAIISLFKYQTLLEAKAFPLALLKSISFKSRVSWRMDRSVLNYPISHIWQKALLYNAFNKV